MINDTIKVLSDELEQLNNKIKRLNNRLAAKNYTSGDTWDYDLKNEERIQVQKELEKVENAFYILDDTIYKLQQL